MSEAKGDFRPKARTPRGFEDRSGADLAAERRAIERIRAVYETYGFAPLSTPAFEYADALGKFLPDQDRPNEGVFALQDDDEQWLSLRYDLTAPLARYVAQNFDALPKPFRRYAVGTVWRNEKPGPGRFREFVQFDADTVGAETMAADAEFCMLLSDALAALGLRAGDAVVKANNRKILDGVLEGIGVTGSGDEARRLTVLRAMDKHDRLGADGVAALLGKGRMDESGDFTRGAGLETKAIDRVLTFLASGAADRTAALRGLADAVRGSRTGEEGVGELAEIDAHLTAAGFAAGRVMFDPAIVRGLAYYTGPVFEAELTFEIAGEDGRPVRFGSVGSGGRYDGLVERFLGRAVPATGASIGVSRLLAALKLKGLAGADAAAGPAVVLVMDREAFADYQAMAAELRAAGIPAEVYLGSSGMRAQLKYADRRGASVAIIQGSDERARGEVTLKDLALGAELSKAIEERADWVAARPAQETVARGDLVTGVRAIRARQGA